MFSEKLMDKSIVTPSRLILLDKGIEKPAISFWLIQFSYLFRGWVPRMMDSSGTPLLSWTDEVGTKTRLSSSIDTEHQAESFDHGIEDSTQVKRH